MLLGNDIVDLQWSPKHRALYFQRLKSYAFSSPELSCLPCESFNEGLRLLWSVKEACYKSAMKNGCSDRFIPQDFVVESIVKNEKLTCCTISHSGEHYKSQSYSNSDHIHSVAIPIKMDFEDVIVGSTVIDSTDYESQSRSVRDLTSNRLSTFYSGEISYRKDERGIPYVHVEGSRTEIDISFSHDQNVVGFALMM